MYNDSRCGRNPDAMLFQVDAFDLPAWAHDELKAQCAERAIGVDELVKYLVCAYVKSLSSHVGTELTVPREMESRLLSEGFMVVRRGADGVLLTPCEPMSLQDALADFHDNGRTEDDVVRAVAG